MQLRQPLLALVPLELRPELQVLVEEGERLRVIFWQSDSFPKLFWQVSTLNRLHVEVAVALVFAHRGVTRVRERTTVSVAQASQVVLIAAEGLRGSPREDKNALLLPYLALKAQ